MWEERARAREHALTRVCTSPNSTLELGTQTRVSQCLARAPDTHHFDFCHHTQRNRAHPSGPMR